MEDEGGMSSWIGLLRMRDIFLPNGLCIRDKVVEYFFTVYLPWEMCCDMSVRIRELLRMRRNFLSPTKHAQYFLTQCAFVYWLVEYFFAAFMHGRWRIEMCGDMSVRIRELLLTRGNFLSPTVHARYFLTQCAFAY
jgi:hypothetical protein